MVKFEGMERRQAKIAACLAENGFSGLEEARALCLEKGVDVVDWLLDLHCVKDWGFSIHLAHMTNRKRGEWGKWTFDRQMMAIFEFDDRPHDAPKVVFRKLEGARLFRLASL